MMRLIAVVCCCLLVGVATARDSRAQISGPYIGFEGGLNVHATGQGRSDSVGFFGGGMAGYGFGGFRVELEVAYRTHEPVVPGADTHVVSGLVNGLYEVDLDFGLIPHLGIGLGIVHADGGVHPAFQGIVGVDFAAMPHVLIGIDYKYLSRLDAEGRSGRSLAYHDHSVAVSAKYSF